MTAFLNRTPLIVTAGQQDRRMLLLEPWLTDVEPEVMPKPSVALTDDTDTWAGQRWHTRLAVSIWGRDAPAVLTGKNRRDRPDLRRRGL